MKCTKFGKILTKDCSVCYYFRKMCNIYMQNEFSNDSKIPHQ